MPPIIIPPAAPWWLALVVLAAWLAVELYRVRRTGRPADQTAAAAMLEAHGHATEAVGTSWQQLNDGLLKRVNGLLDEIKALEREVLHVRDQVTVLRERNDQLERQNTGLIADNVALREERDRWRLRVAGCAAGDVCPARKGSSDEPRPH